jgi:hypothetical protein
VALVELQKRLGDGEGRLKQQQTLYEAVRADRNMYSKSLIEAQVCVCVRCEQNACQWHLHSTVWYHSISALVCSTASPPCATL